MKTLLIFLTVFSLALLSGLQFGCNSEPQGVEETAGGKKLIQPVTGMNENYETLRTFNHENYQYEVFGYGENLYEVILIEGAPVFSGITSSLYGVTWVPGSGYKVIYTDPYEERAYAIVVDGGSLSLQEIN